MSKITAPLPDNIYWIRPWYPAGVVGHLSPDCPDLLRVEPEPCEGAGWLDPRDSHTCRACLDRHGYASWHAECATCGRCLCDDYTDQPYVSEVDAKRWKDEHVCEPEVVIKAPPKPVAPSPPGNQPALFPPANLPTAEAAA